VRATRRLLHVHSERIYLAGVCEGAGLAYRLALGMPDKVAGVIALNGSMPRPAGGGPLFRLPDVRGLRVLIGHGVANSVVPLGVARRDFRVLYSAGLDVTLRTYPTTNRLHPHMLRDVNRWIMRNVAAERIVVDAEDEADELEY
jgi:phospholipase/carboxylesterase